MTVLPFALAGVCGLMLLGLALVQLAGGRTRASDRAGRRMGRARALEPRAARRTAARLGVQVPGLTIGRTAQGGRTLIQGWEDCSLDVAGPRVGKTTCRVVPAIREAPGAVITTSNKTDAWAATREQRAKTGHVWTFDPQGLTGEPAAFWWNPLGFATNQVRAAELADVFAAADRDPNARSDAFFAPKGQKLVAALLLAAACSGRTIDQCYRWVTDPRDDEPAELLRDHGHALLADALTAETRAPEKQRAGVYSSAEATLSFLTNPDALAWVTPGHGRTEFRPDEFVAGTGTLYSLSKEGRGSAGALVAGLTVAVTDAAEQLAKQSTGGRLPIPLVVVLDEACNVCRWPELPNLYSHYGSRGIVLLTFAQSWSQLSEAFGAEGARKLWSAATIKVYGGGVTEAAFLEDLSRLIGDYDQTQTSTAQSRHGRATTRSTQRRRILDVAELGSLPKGRAVVLSAGSPPVLARTIPWWDR